VNAHTAIIAEIARDTDLSPRECNAVARVMAPKLATVPEVKLSQRHREVMSAYRDVIDQDSPAGRAARATRAWLIEQQEKGL
jgi:hypothetical protein